MVVVVYMYVVLLLRRQQAVVDIGSVPTDHSLAHIPPLPVLDMRPLALETDDPLQVNVWLNDTQFSIHTVLGPL